MADERDYTAGVPIEPPEGMIDFVLSKGALNENVIVYSVDYVIDAADGMKKKMVHCKCSACKREFHENYVSAGVCYGYSSAAYGFTNHATSEKVISGMTTMCPECTEPVKALNISRICSNGHCLGSVYPMSVHRVDDLIYLLSWEIAKWVEKNGSIKIKVNPYEGYAFDGRKTKKIVGYNRYFYSSCYTGKWEAREKCIDTYGDANLLFPFNADILTGTRLENSKLDLFANAVENPPLVAYLKLFQRHKNVENLVMQGASAILNGKIKATQHTLYTRKGYTSMVEGIDWKSRRPSEMLGLNKDEFKLCVKHKWDLSDLNLYVYAKENGTILTEEEVKFINDKFSPHHYKMLFEYDRPRKVSVVRSFKYLAKQRGRYNNTATVNDLCDYWDMSRKLGDELVTDADIFPQNLVRAHDNCTDRINAAKDAKRDEEFKERYNALRDYCFEYEGLCIRPPMSAAELRAEGKALNHCVFSYADRHASGQTAILFIRHCDEPDKPYFTLELDEKNLTVRQNRGKGNCARTEEVVAFEEKWLSAIHKIFKKKKVRVTA